MSRAALNKEFSGEIPTGTYGPAMHLTETLEGWRNKKPLIDSNICNKCEWCYLVCPEGVIYTEDNQIKIDYRYCKGCGICAKECKKCAIKMEKEDAANEK
ncbi:MAG TPA: 4Fe-4S binding protein [Ruminiclostridium sp.]|jgi:pyruvate ferredoxin oxidoreductase delta subunit|nr:4Fe-4S binding protein [Ruminiclostridium sp.]